MAGRHRQQQHIVFRAMKVWQGRGVWRGLGGRGAAYVRFVGAKGVEAVIPLAGGAWAAAGCICAKIEQQGGGGQLTSDSWVQRVWRLVFPWRWAWAAAHCICAKIEEQGGGDGRGAAYVRFMGVKGVEAGIPLAVGMGSSTLHPSHQVSQALQTCCCCIICHMQPCLQLHVRFFSR